MAHFETLSGSIMAWLSSVSTLACMGAFSHIYTDLLLDSSMNMTGLDYQCNVELCDKLMSLFAS